jgi:hypothetical protein
MDTSTFLCSGMSIQMSLSSVIQSGTFCLWDKSPIQPRLSSFDDGDDPMLEQHNHSPYKRLNVLLLKPCNHLNISVRSAKALDAIDSQGYDNQEEQGNKIASAISLARNGSYLSAIRLRNLVRSVGIKPGHISPCQNVTNNVLDAHSSYNAQTVSNSPGVFPIHTLLRYGLEDVRFFCFKIIGASSRMNKFLRKVQRLLNNLNYTTSLIESQHSSYSFSCRLTSAESEGRQW